MKKSCGERFFAAAGTGPAAAPILLAVLLFLVVLWATATPAAAANGERVYEGKCRSCHGEDGTGRGGLFDLPDLTREGMWSGNTQNRLIDVVEDGRGEMPGFGGMLSDEEVEAVLRYEAREFGGVNWSEIPEGEPVGTDGSTSAPGFAAPVAVLGAAAALFLLRRRR